MGEYAGYARTGSLIRIICLDSSPQTDSQGTIPLVSQTLSPSPTTAPPVPPAPRVASVRRSSTTYSYTIPIISATGRLAFYFPATIQARPVPSLFNGPGALPASHLSSRRSLERPRRRGGNLQSCVLYVNPSSAYPVRVLKTVLWSNRVSLQCSQSVKTTSRTADASRISPGDSGIVITARRSKDRPPPPTFSIRPYTPSRRIRKTPGSRVLHPILLHSSRSPPSSRIRPHSRRQLRKNEFNPRGFGPVK
jgi:hypothetical protein